MFVDEITFLTTAEVKNFIARSNVEAILNSKTTSFLIGLLKLEHLGTRVEPVPHF